jgi:hypothetical protein
MRRRLLRNIVRSNLRSNDTMPTLRNNAGKYSQKGFRDVQSAWEHLEKTRKGPHPADVQMANVSTGNVLGRLPVRGLADEQMHPAPTMKPKPLAIARISLSLAPPPCISAWPQLTVLWARLNTFHRHTIYRSFPDESGRTSH